jgi:hypothetical protein
VPEPSALVTLYLLKGPGPNKLPLLPCEIFPEITVEDAVKTLKLNVEVTLPVVTETFCALLDVSPKPISALAVKAVVELLGTINAQPLLPVVHCAP